MIPCMTLELVYPYLSTCCSTNVVVLPLISNMRAKVLQEVILITASVFFVTTSILVPLFLTASEQVHLAKYFSDLTWLCFRVKVINQYKQHKKISLFSIGGLVALLYR